MNLVSPKQVVHSGDVVVAQFSVFSWVGETASLFSVDGSRVELEHCGKAGGIEAAAAALQPIRQPSAMVPGSIPGAWFQVYLRLHPCTRQSVYLSRLMWMIGGGAHRH